MPDIAHLLPPISSVLSTVLRLPRRGPVGVPVCHLLICKTSAISVKCQHTLSSWTSDEDLNFFLTKITLFKIQAASGKFPRPVERMIRLEYFAVQPEKLSCSGEYFSQPIELE